MAKKKLFPLKKHLPWILVHFVPKRFITWIVAKLSRIVFPKLIFSQFLEWFIRKYSINSKEMLLPISAYRTFADFFSRAIHWQKRSVVDRTSQVVSSPVDGRLVSYGEVCADTYFRVKGVDYALNELMPDSKYRQLFNNADWISIYLSPGNYHRVHLPMAGALVAVEYQPGNLFPVNRWALTKLDNLFCVNERLISYFKTQFGMMAVVKIAALNVGNIVTDYFTIPTKKHFWHSNPLPVFTNMYVTKYVYEKLDEIAQFQLGSMVIVFFEKGMCQFRLLNQDEKLYVGQPIADVIDE